jgi:hypothetical protein
MASFSKYTQMKMTMDTGNSDSSGIPDGCLILVVFGRVGSLHCGALTRHP